MTDRASLERLARNLPIDQLPDLIADLERTKAVAWTRLNAPAAPAAPDRLVDAAEMAEMLDVPENWVRDKARAGALPFRQLGHYVRFSPPEVLEAVRRMPQSHDCALRGLKKRKETRGGSRRVSTECPTSRPEESPEVRHG